MTSTATTRPVPAYANLIEALAADPPDAVIARGIAQLSAGGNGPLLMAIVKALVTSGLAGMAVRLLESARGIVAPLQLQPLLNQLRNLPSSEINRDQLKQQLTRNVEQLAAQGIHIEPSIIALDGVNAYRTLSGNTWVLKNTPGQFHPALPILDARTEAARLALPEPSMASSTLIMGVPSHWLWHRIVDARHANGFLPPIDLIEPDPDVFSIWLALLDDVTALQSERVHCSVGPHALADYYMWLESHAWRTPAATILTSPRPDWQPPAIDRVRLQHIADERVQRSLQKKVALDQHYAVRTSDWWRHRFVQARAGGEPLRVVGFTSLFSTVLQHSMRDLIAAFNRAGCIAHLVKQPHASCASVDVAASLHQHRPDLIIVIDHLRSELRDAIPAGVPYVCWVQDHMDQLCTRQAGSSVGELDLMLGHAPAVMSDLYGYPLDRFLPTSNLTDPQQYSDQPMTIEDRQKYECDISYVSHGAAPIDQFIASLSQTVSTRYQRMLEACAAILAERLHASGWVNAQDLVEVMLQGERASGHQPLPPEIRRAHVYPQIAAMFDRLVRHQALRWAAQWADARGRQLRIYGRGWEANPEFARYAANEIESGVPLRCVYQASKISLQVNGYSSLHQRLLDGLASGACMLTRYNPADFVRQPFARISEYIQRHALTNLRELLDERAANPELARWCDEAERFSSVPIALASSASRRRHNEINSQGNRIPELMSDEGLFDSLRTLRHMPVRVASDIDGFDRTLFSTCEQLHQMLDALVDRPEKRNDLSAPMRQCILQHDTYDGLVKRILNHFMMVRS